MSAWHTDRKAFRRLFELVEKSLQGTLNAAEHDELDHLLRTDHQAAEVYLQIVDESCILRAWARGGLELAEAAARGETYDEPSTVPSRSARPWSDPIARAIDWHSHPVRFLATISVLTLMFLSVLAIWIWPRQAHHQQAAQRPSALAGQMVTLAKVIGAHQAEEQPDSAPTFVGAHLRTGQAIRLKAGLVKIRFQDGAETIVEGPAEFTVVDSNRGHLEIGRLVAHITTPTAAGFRIDTPKSTIVDLGTEFGLEVDERGDHDVSVFQGSVQVRLAQLGSREPITVRRGQTLRVDGAEGALVRSSAASRKFVRRLFSSGQTVSPDAERLTETFDHLTAASYPGWKLDGQGGWNVLQGQLTLRNDYTTGRFDRHVAFGSGRAYRVLDEHWQKRLAASQQIVWDFTARTGGHYSKAGLGYFDGTRFHVGFAVGDNGENDNQQACFAAYVGSGQGDSVTAVGTSQDRYPKAETIADYRLTLDLTTMTGTLQVDTGNGYFVPRGMERLDFSMLNEIGEGGRNVRRWNSLYLRSVSYNDAWDNLRLTCLPAAEAGLQKPVPATDSLEP